MCIRTFLNFKEQETNKQNKNQKEQKKLKKEKRISSENRLKKKICGRPGEDFSGHTHFPKQELFLFFFLPKGVSCSLSNLFLFDFNLTKNGRAISKYISVHCTDYSFWCQ